MLTFSLTILVLVVGGAVSFDVECLPKRRKECQFPNLQDFPQTKEEVDETCRQGIRYLRCVRAAQEECDAPVPVAKYLADLLDYIEKEICNEDSKIYQALANNVECIEKPLKVANEACPSRALELRENMPDSLISILSMEGHEEEARDICLYGLFRSACTAAILSETCGESVGEAFANVTTNVNPNFTYCPSEIKGQLLYVVRVMRSVGEAEQDIMRQRKK